MDNIKVNQLNMATQVLKQYRDLSLKSNKVFHYSYGRLDIKLQSIIKDNEVPLPEVLDGEVVDLTVRLTYPEIKSLLGINRVRLRELETIVNNLEENSTFVLEYDNTITRFFLYKRITIHTKDKYIEVEFNENAVTFFELLRVLPYSRLEFEEIVLLETKYQMNLYLYAITILRGYRGVLSINIENLRDILAKESTIDNNNFYHRFVSKPAKEINNLQGINLEIQTQREGSNVNIIVNKNKEVK